LLLEIPFASQLRRVGYIVSRASDHILVACLRSLRLKIQPVCLMTLAISNNHHCDFVSQGLKNPRFPDNRQWLQTTHSGPSLANFNVRVDRAR
jgi:hypothetical protein